MPPYQKTLSGIYESLFLRICTVESSKQKTPKWTILKNLSTTSNGCLFFVEQRKLILNGMRHKVLDGKNANADTIQTEIFATESIAGSGKKRLFFPQLNWPEFSNNYCVSNGVGVFTNKSTVDAELALNQNDASLELFEKIHVQKNLSPSLWYLLTVQTQPSFALASIEKASFFLRALLINIFDSLKRGVFLDKLKHGVFLTI